VAVVSTRPYVKSAPHPRQITIPASHHSSFLHPIPATQPIVSKHLRQKNSTYLTIYKNKNKNLFYCAPIKCNIKMQYTLLTYNGLMGIFYVTIAYIAYKGRWYAGYWPTLYIMAWLPDDWKITTFHHYNDCFINFNIPYNFLQWKMASTLFFTK